MGLALDGLLEGLRVRGVVEAVFRTRSGQLYVIVSRSGKAFVRGDGGKTYVIGLEALLEDIAQNSYAEMLAHKLLIPHEPLKGQQLLEQLQKTYRKEVVQQLVRDLVAEHKLAAANLIIQPEYFLYEKLRRLSELTPFFGPGLAECLTDIEWQLAGFGQAAEELVEAGFLTKRGGGYSPSTETVTRYSKTTAIPLVEQLKKLNILRASKVFINLFEPTGLGASRPQIPDPEQYLHIQTARGPQPLVKQLGIEEFVAEHYGGGARVRRIGGLFNSTYLIEFGGTRLLAKRYLSWTDVKWVAARIWTAWVKDFSIDPATRMAKEIYFTEALRANGFNTPETVHVNWEGKILYRTYVEGSSLLEAWLGGSGDRAGFAGEVGLLLARIHEKGFRIGDCKPECFIKSPDGRIYVMDVEQASYDGDPAWDLMELILYPGHYLDASDAAQLAEAVVKGYLEAGRPETVRKALKPSYVRTMALWTPPWIQKTVVDRVKQVTA